MTFYKPREKKNLLNNVSHAAPLSIITNHLLHPPPQTRLTVQISQRRRHDIKGNLAVSGSINIPFRSASQVMREPSFHHRKGKNLLYKKLLLITGSLSWSLTAETRKRLIFYDAKRQKLVEGKDLGRKKKKKNPLPVF